MKNALQNHPCFNPEAKHRYGRIHLPVAPRCNVQCNFCNRKFDCVNESGPGITSVVLKPREAIRYCADVLGRRPEIKVLGIAGPGDPFANPDQTLETLHLAKERFPDVILCLSTNGLALPAYIDEIHALGVRSVTLTVNSFVPRTVASIYSWIRINGEIQSGTDAANALIKSQSRAIRLLVERSITVKVNTVVIPGVNEEEIASIAQKLALYGVSLFNPIPMKPARRAHFSYINEPSASLMSKIKSEAARHIQIMPHCYRCRADSVGLLGEAMTTEMFDDIKSYSHADGQKKQNNNKKIAVATSNGHMVDLMIGETKQFAIYEVRDESYRLDDFRKATDPDCGERRWTRSNNVN
jgi:nitrogen fixation protein NifB